MIVQATPPPELLGGYIPPIPSGIDTHAPGYKMYNYKGLQCNVQK